MGLLDAIFGTDKKQEPEEKDPKKPEKGFFEGGDEITIEDMCIMDILDEDEW